MIFTSIIFLFAFLPPVFILCIVLRNHVHAMNLFLLVASILFYAWGEPKYVVLIFFSILFNYGAAILLGRASKCRKIILGSAIVVNIGMLFYFKYMNWSITLFNGLCNTEIARRNLTLPIGISFYIFQALSYVVDVYRGTVKAQRNVLKVGLYISLFPQLVAGPIVRYVDIEKQISDRKICIDDAAAGIKRFMFGFSKKVLLADSFAIVADAAFAMNANGTLGGGHAWLGAVSYTLQIFYDFSGYSDMAIGLGKMMGFTLPENFHYPYLAGSVTDFWHRWHISLSSWFRDYVYIPLGGNRKGKARMYLNLAVTWLATGLWHGANMTFILWGGIYGTLIIGEKLLNIPKRLEKSHPLQICYRGAVLLMIVLCWVIFRSDNIYFAGKYLKTMFTMRAPSADVMGMVIYLRQYVVEYIVGIIGAFPLLAALKRRRSQKVWEIFSTLMAWSVFLVSISYLIKGTYSPFIYFNF